MEMIVADQLIMGLIIYAGDAKSHAYQALSLVKADEEERAEEELELADAALLEAHNMQTKFLAQEAGGAKSDITALFVHSQDHLMTSITEINLIKEIIDLRKELKKVC
ncbi:PTS lactose/cellobiose transporter subunit IIA [Streptococcus suis]|uniref:PTS lactose/cellobiose transporter subunit IIA n=1 Tax=Streptococcus suis TaxID=1307 RepID=UPI0014797769|nr:PTS lactose/cellobiose transporter subunit IIA [Streptococcus suis]